MVSFCVVGVSVSEVDGAERVGSHVEGHRMFPWRWMESLITFDPDPTLAHTLIFVIVILL